MSTTKARRAVRIAARRGRVTSVLLQAATGDDRHVAAKHLRRAEGLGWLSRESRGPRGLISWAPTSSGRAVVSGLETPDLSPATRAITGVLGAEWSPTAQFAAQTRLPLRTAFDCLRRLVIRGLAERSARRGTGVPALWRGRRGK